MLSVRRNSQCTETWEPKTKAAPPHPAGHYACTLIPLALSLFNILFKKDFTYLLSERGEEREEERDRNIDI